MKDQLQQELDLLRVDRSELEQRAANLRKKIEENDFEVRDGKIFEKDDDSLIWAVVYHWVLFDRYDKNISKNVCSRWRGAKELTNEEYAQILKAAEDKDEIDLENVYYDGLVGGPDIDVPFGDGHFHVNGEGHITFKVTAGDYRVGHCRDESNILVHKMKRSDIDAIEDVAREQVFMER